MAFMEFFRIISALTPAEQEKTGGEELSVKKDVSLKKDNFSSATDDSDLLVPNVAKNHLSAFKKHQEQIQKLMKKTEEEFNKKLVSGEAESNKDWDVIGIVDEKNHKEIMAQRASGNTVEKIYKKAVKDKNGYSQVFSFSSFSSSSPNRPNFRESN